MVPPAGIPNKPAAGEPCAAPRDPDGSYYWNTLASDQLQSFEIPLWRRYADHLHQTWIRERTGSLRFKATLKTDLFEEAIGEGLADCLAQSSDHLFGIDLSPHVVSKASIRHPVFKARAADVRDLPFEDGFFDRIVSISTLDHFDTLADLHLGLRELTRVLAPGGHLFLTLDNPTNPLLAVRGLLPSRAFGLSSILPYRIGASLGANELCHAIETTGLRVHEVVHLMHVPRILALHLCRFVPPRGRSHEWLLRWMLALERIQRWASAPFTGHFVAIHATSATAPAFSPRPTPPNARTTAPPPHAPPPARP